MSAMEQKFVLFVLEQAEKLLHVKRDVTLTSIGLEIKFTDPSGRVCRMTLHTLLTSGM